MDNPYWEAVKDRCKPGEFPWEPGLQIERFDLTGEHRLYEPEIDRHALVRIYSWTVTDPESIDFVAAHADGGLVDPMAGTGYWAYVLAQLGVDVVCYDANPCHTNNPWHHDAPLWVPVAQGYAEVVIDAHPDRVLLLAWPPYSEPSGNRVLREYAGQRVIYMGESEGGCTGDEDMHERLEAEWVEVAERVPVQWWGLHDRITVYERKDTGDE